MKKIISILLVLMLVCLCACKKEEKNPEKTPEKNTSSSSSPIVHLVMDDSKFKGLCSDTENGTHIVKNKGDNVSFALIADAHMGKEAMYKIRLKWAIDYINKADDIDFAVFLGDNIDGGHSGNATVIAEEMKIFNENVAEFKKPFYALPGNHDPNIEGFEHNMIVECEDVAIIGFYAGYYTKDPSKIYESNGRVPEATLTWLEKAFEQCKGKRIILACHFSIVEGDQNFSAPIPSASPVPLRNEEWVDFGREKILELAEKYGAELYFNGHEHNEKNPSGTAGIITDYSIASLGEDFTFPVVTVYKDKAVIDFISTAEREVKKVNTVEYVFKR